MICTGYSNSGCGNGKRTWYLVKLDASAVPGLDYMMPHIKEGRKKKEVEEEEEERTECEGSTMKSRLNDTQLISEHSGELLRSTRQARLGI